MIKIKADKESACNEGDMDSIPGSGRSPGEGNGNHSSILTWKIPWTEKPGKLWSVGSQRVSTVEPLSTQAPLAKKAAGARKTAF